MSWWNALWKSEDKSDKKNSPKLIFKNGRVMFHCTDCGHINGLVLSEVDRLVGRCVLCDSCRMISHIPGSVLWKKQPDDFEITPGTRQKIADFPEWYTQHPITKELLASGHSSYHIHYGLWAFCSKCYYEYEHQILSTFVNVIKIKGFIFNAHSAKSASDMDGLLNNSCPNCGHDSVIVLVGKIPVFVREKIAAL